jgi:hypothetical protein
LDCQWWDLIKGRGRSTYHGPCDDPRASKPYVMNRNRFWAVGNIPDDIGRSRRSAKMSECQEGMDDSSDIPGSIEV